jgi:hypothetical protein
VVCGNRGLGYDTSVIVAAPSASAQTGAGIAELTSGIRTGAPVPYGQVGVNLSWTVPSGQYLALVRISYSLRSFEHAATLRCSLHRPNEGRLDISLVSVTGGQPVGSGPAER